MDYQTATEPFVCKDGDTLKMIDGRPTVVRDGKPVAVVWANTREEFEIRTPRSEPLCYVEMEYNWNSRSKSWVPYKIGPMPKALAEEVFISYSGSNYRRNVRVVEAGKREWWVNENYHRFAYDSKELAIHGGALHPVPWDRKTTPIGFCVSTEPQP